METLTCYHPIPAFQRDPGAAVRLHPPKGTENLALPCGKCIGCRTDRATMWADRCTHEANRWANNSFLTLTYADEKLPKTNEVQPRDLQLFLKRLRRYAESRNNNLNRDHHANIRFFGCGEYGSQTGRPHYHILLFNCKFTDDYRVAANLTESPTLNTLWGNGACRLGEVTPASAAYIAQYNIKKQGGGEVLDPETGLLRRPPFLHMSNRPAIGKQWLQQYHTDLRNGKLITSGGRKHTIPRYYRDQIKKDYPNVSEDIEVAMATARARLQHYEDRSEEERLRAAEQIHYRRKQLSKQRR